MTEPASLYSLAGKRVWVAGHRGMVGSALVRPAGKAENCEILTVADRKRVDLTPAGSRSKLDGATPAAGDIPRGGEGRRHPRQRHPPAEFLYDNLMIAANVIQRRADSASRSCCSSARPASIRSSPPQPIAEDALLTGPLEPTNQWYAIAKIAGIKLCQAYRAQYGCDFISAMPTNLYGPGDNFDLRTSHVMPALIAQGASRPSRAGAEEIVVWGTGTPRREFLHVDDCRRRAGVSDEALFRLRHVNVGVGDDISIADLARLVADVVGFRGRLRYDSSMPDGTPRKLLDVSRLSSLGWRSRITLRAGIEQTYRWYLQQLVEAETRDALREHAPERHAPVEIASPSWQAQ